MGILSLLLQQRASKVIFGHPSGGSESWYSVPTASGQAVTPKTAFVSAAVYCAIATLSETVASLPLIVYRRLARGKDRARKHPAYRVLHDQPNPRMSSFAFRETLMGHLLTWGNAFAQIERDEKFLPVYLWPLNPSRMRITPWTSTNQELSYLYTTEKQGIVELRNYEVLHVRGLGDDGILGYSPVTLAREALGLTMACQEYGARFFSNDSRPGGVLQHPQKLSPEAYARLKENWTEMHAGASAAHRTAILEEGLHWQQVGIAPDDAQFLDTRKFQVEEIARIFRLPPHMLRDLTRSTYSNIEQQAIDFVTYSIRPWLVRWEQEVNFKLFPEYEEAEYFAEHLVDALLRGDTQSRFGAYAIGRQWGWLSANDVRERENMNPLPDAQGDLYLVPMNMTPAEKAGRMAEQVGRIAATHRALIADVLGRMLHREVAYLWRLRKQEEPKAEFEKFYGEHEKLIGTTVRPVVVAYLEAMRCCVPSAELKTMEPEKVAADIARRHVLISGRALAGELSAELVKSTIEDWEAGRSFRVLAEDFGESADPILTAAKKGISNGRESDRAALPANAGA